MLFLKLKSILIVCIITFIVCLQNCQCQSEVTTDFVNETSTETESTLPPTDASSTEAIVIKKCENNGVLDEETNVCNCTLTPFQGPVCNQPIGIRTLVTETFKIPLPKNLSLNGLEISLSVAADESKADILNFKNQVPAANYAKLTMDNGQFFFIWSPRNQDSTKQIIRLGTPVNLFKYRQESMYYMDLYVRFTLFHREGYVSLDINVNDQKIQVEKLKTALGMTDTLDMLEVEKFSGCLINLSVNSRYFPLRYLRYPTPYDPPEIKETKKMVGWQANPNLHCDIRNPYEVLATEGLMHSEKVLWVLIPFTLLIICSSFAIIYLKIMKKQKKRSRKTVRGKEAEN